jgi:flavin reductase (DIM6/NTAB) family NADH-FMN oxidoreductase RutF
MIRSTSQRIAHTLAALDRERTCWISVGRKDGSSHLIPVSFCWDGVQLVVATRRQSVTAEAARRTGRVRVSLPSTDDVVIIDATATIVTLEQIDVATHLFYRQVTGRDPARETDPFVYVVLSPVRILAWRDDRERARREIMRESEWITDDDA